MTTTNPKQHSPAVAWRCQVCGHTFRSRASASLAMSVGCPHCGDTDIDYTTPIDGSGAGVAS